MEKETGASDTEDVMGKYGWFKPSKAFLSVNPGKGDKWLPPAYEPRAEMTEIDGEVILHVELPGVKKEEIKISATEDRIDISVESGCQEEHKEKTGEYIYNCRYTGFSGSYVMPGSIVTDEVSASYKDGVLEIRAKKSGLDRRKKVKID